MTEHSQIEGMLDTATKGLPIFLEKLNDHDLTRKIVLDLHDKIFVEHITSKAQDHMSAAMTDIVHDIAASYVEHHHLSWSSLSPHQKMQTVDALAKAMFYWVVSSVVAVEVLDELNTGSDLESILREYGGGN